MSHPDRTNRTVKEAGAGRDAGAAHLGGMSTTTIPRLALTPEQREARWTEQFEGVRLYFLIHGKWPTKASRHDPTRLLGEWLHRQRQCDNKGILSAAHKKALDQMGEEVGQPWHPRQARRSGPSRSDTIAEIEQFHRLNGYYPTLTRKDPAERRLAKWLDNRMVLHREGALNPVIEQELEQMSQRLGHAWNAPRPKGHRPGRGRGSVRG